MTSKLLIPISMLLLAASLVFSSCGKDGTTGPAGAKGDKGDKGDTGATGPKGDAGDSIIYSGWLDVNYKADTLHTAGGGIDTIGWYAVINAPRLTATLLSNADIHMYINVNTPADPVVYPLPYVGISGLNISYQAYTGTIQLYANGDISTFVDDNGNKSQQYRYVIAPGTVNARTKNAIDWNNYAAVKAYFRLNN